MLDLSLQWLMSTRSMKCVYFRFPIFMSELGEKSKYCPLRCVDQVKQIKHRSWIYKYFLFTLFMPCIVVKDRNGVRRLNFARLIINYTRRFALTDVREALQYFFLLKVTYLHL